MSQQLLMMRMRPTSSRFRYSRAWAMRMVQRQPTGTVDLSLCLPTTGLESNDQLAQSMTENVIDVAVRLLAGQPGAPDRILRQHRERPDGWCAGCWHARARWPCSVAAMAITAQELIGGNPELHPTTSRSS